MVEWFHIIPFLSKSKIRIDSPPKFRNSEGIHIYHSSNKIIQAWSNRNWLALKGLTAYEFLQISLEYRLFSYVYNREEFFELKANSSSLLEITDPDVEQWPRTKAFLLQFNSTGNLEMSL